MKYSIRKTDLFLQMTIVILSILLVPFGGILTILLGFIFTGVLQLLSSMLNSYSFYHEGFGRRLVCYWILASVCIVVYFYPGIFNILPAWSSLIIILCAYYWIIYDELINRIEIRNELSGLTKSKH